MSEIPITLRRGKYLNTEIQSLKFGNTAMQCHKYKLEGSWNTVLILMQYWYTVFKNWISRLNMAYFNAESRVPRRIQISK